MTNNNKKELQSLEKTRKLLLDSSWMGKESSRNKSEPRRLPRQEFESMDDIKPMARSLPIIAKKPLPTTMSSNTTE